MSESHLVFVWKPSGYELREAAGDPPTVGSEVEQDGRLMQVTNGRKIDAGKPAQPTLRKRNDNSDGNEGPVLRKPEK